MTRKGDLHPGVGATTPRYAMVTQIALRWISTLAGAIVAVLVGRAVDLYHQGGPNFSLPGNWWAWVVVMISVAAITMGVASALSLRNQSETERGLREASQRAWVSLGPIRIRGREGALLDLATNGALRAARYRGGFMAATVASLSAPVVVALVMGVELGWKVAGIMALVIIVGPLVIGAFQGVNKDVGDRFRASQTHLRGAFLEGIRALESLAYAGAGGRYAADLAETNEQHRRKIMRLLGANQLLILIMDLAFSLAALVLATILAVNGLQGGALTLGQALSLILLTLLLVAPVDLIGQFFYIGIGGRAAQRQFSALLREQDQAEEDDRRAVAHHQVPDAEQRSTVVVENLTAGWPDGPDLFEGASLTIDQGEHVALVGPSGVGKSTLSAILQGLLHARSGNVLVAGSQHTSPDGPTADAAVVEQRSYLFNGTIAENLRLVRPDATDDELWAVLEQANLAGEVRAMPSALQTQLGDHGSRLSGGQAGRLAIARALLKDAPFLILDEPTSQVDLASEALILDALEQASEGRAVLTIAHRRAAVRKADRVLQVKDRHIVEAGENNGQ